MVTNLLLSYSEEQMIKHLKEKFKPNNNFLLVRKKAASRVKAFIFPFLKVMWTELMEPDYILYIDIDTLYTCKLYRGKKEHVYTKQMISDFKVEELKNAINISFMDVKTDEIIEFYMYKKYGTRLQYNVNNYKYLQSINWYKWN